MQTFMLGHEDYWAHKRHSQWAGGLESFPGGEGAFGGGKATLLIRFIEALRTMQ